MSLCNFRLLRFLLLAVALSNALVASATFVDEEHCFGGLVPTTPVGRTATTDVSGGNNTFYTVTAWRQKCDVDPEAYVLMLQFSPKLGQPRPGAVDVYQNGVSTGHTTILVKNPRSSDSWERYFFSPITGVTNAIVVQEGTVRFDARAKLTIDFHTEGAGGSLVLLPEVDAPDSYWAADGINDYDLSDMWWNPDEAGTGLSLIKHGSNEVFGVWYTYNDDGSPMWLVMPGGKWDGGTFTGSLYKTRGASFRTPWDPSKFQVGDPVGTASIKLDGADHIIMQYAIGSSSGTKEFVRQRF